MFLLEMEEKVEKALGQIKVAAAVADETLTSLQSDSKRDQLPIEKIPLAEVEKKDISESKAGVEDQQKKESIR